MKSLYISYVTLARSAHHIAMGCHRLNDTGAETYWNQRVQEHMLSARRCKFFDCYSCK